MTLTLRNFKAAAIAGAVRANYHIEAPEPPLRTVVQRRDTIAENTLLLDLMYTFNRPVSNLKVTSTLDRITQADHSHILQVGEGDSTREAVLNASNPFIDIDLRDKSWWETVWDFVRLGIEHIFTGYDHLAFLLGLLFMTRTLASLLKVVTSFTAAHSITLALATLGIVSVPSRAIEGLIALRIAYSAIENFMGQAFISTLK